MGRLPETIPTRPVGDRERSQKVGGIKTRNNFRIDLVTEVTNAIISRSRGNIKINIKVRTHQKISLTSLTNEFKMKTLQAKAMLYKILTTYNYG